MWSEGRCFSEGKRQQVLPTTRQTCVHLLSRVYLFYFTIARYLRCVRKPFNVFFFLFVHVFSLKDDFFFIAKFFFLTLFKLICYFIRKWYLRI